MLKLLLPFIKHQLADFLTGIVNRSKVIPDNLKPLLIAEISKELGTS